MQTQTLPETTPVETGPDDDLVHYVCCDPDLAFCGRDVSNAAWTNADGNVCHLCQFIYEERWACSRCGD